MIASGELQRHVYDTLQPSYGRRYQKMALAIQRELVPLGARMPQTDRRVVGGYFIWVTLPPGLKSVAVVQRAQEEENVVVAQVRDVPEYTDYTNAPCLGRDFRGAWRHRARRDSL